MHTHRRLALPLALVLMSCATRGASSAAPGTPPAASLAVEDDGTVPAWDSRPAIRNIFPQGAVLSLARPLCPFLYQSPAPIAPTLVAIYDRNDFHGAPMSLRLSFRTRPGASGGWGIGCLGRYDARLYSYLIFWIKGRIGTRYRFVLKDSASIEGVMERQITQEGWHRVTLPLKELRGVDLGSLESLGLRFTAELGDVDIHVDEFEFATR